MEGKGKGCCENKEVSYSVEDVWRRIDSIAQSLRGKRDGSGPFFFAWVLKGTRNQKQCLFCRALGEDLSKTASGVVK